MKFYFIFRRNDQVYHYQSILLYLTSENIWQTTAKTIEVNTDYSYIPIQESLNSLFFVCSKADKPHF